MENILVFDNLLEKDFLKMITDMIRRKKWEYGHVSNNKDDKSSPFYVVELLNEPLLVHDVKQLIEEKCGKKFTINRVYANGQTFGQNGSYHKDDERDHTFTFCLYIHDIEDKDMADADGHLHIRIPDKQFVASIEPYNNRGVLFPSNWLHKGCAFNRYFSNLRVCIAWKLIEIVE